MTEELVQLVQKEPVKEVSKCVEKIHQLGILLQGHS